MTYASTQVVAIGGVYHKACFKCTTCSKTMPVGGTFDHGGELFCKSCYTRDFGRAKSSSSISAGGPVNIDASCEVGNTASQDEGSSPVGEAYISVHHLLKSPRRVGGSVGHSTDQTDETINPAVMALAKLKRASEEELQVSQRA